MVEKIKDTFMTSYICTSATSSSKIDSYIEKFMTYLFARSNRSIFLIYIELILRFMGP